MHKHEISIEGSVDSIGSCSLDVNADTTTDFSDTSSSYNFPEESSKKDNFCNNLGVNAIDAIDETDQVSSFENTFSDCLKVTPVKKPSYLNLACCVNGYSSSTKYDSIFRQCISNVPPSYTQPLPVLSKNLKSVSADKFEMSTPIRMDEQHNGSSKAGFDTTDKISSTNFKLNITQKSTIDVKRDTKSFVQQRVEKLYGKEAIAQGIYSPKSARPYSVIDCNESVLNRNGKKDLKQQSNELKYENQENTNDLRNELDLPVFRHLRPEFRAQLPIVSPKKELKPKVGNEYVVSPRYKSESNLQLKNDGELDNNNVATDNSNCKKQNIATNELTNLCDTSCNSSTRKDGHYFLQLLSTEQNRLLCMAKEAEELLDTLSKNDSISEDVFGFLRSASGKARLLATKKMKQFEGLCRNNLNGSPDEKFPTTEEDLQGFWDMVHLQVDNVDSIFKEIYELKANNWQNNHNESSQKPINSIPKRSNLLKPVKAMKSRNSPAESAASQKRAIAASLAATRRDQQRKQLMELKKKNKLAMCEQQQPSEENPIEMFINNSST